MAAPRQGLSDSQVEKALGAIQYLSSLQIPGESAPHGGVARRPDATPLETTASEAAAQVDGKAVMVAADKALSALNRIRAGITANKRVADRQKRAKKEVSSLFRCGPSARKAKSEKKVAWRHKFVCLAYRDQDRSPTTDADKDELFQAGLGEKEITFPSLDIDAAAFKELLLESFPKLKEGGGYQLLKGLPNSRNLEVLSLVVHTSPGLLKQRVGNSRTYIRPIQKDLDLTPIEESIDAPLEKCLTCGSMYPLDELPEHALECEKAYKEVQQKSDSKKSSKRHHVHVDSDDEEESPSKKHQVVYVDLTPGDNSSHQNEVDIPSSSESDDLPSMEEALFNQAIQESLNNSHPSTSDHGGDTGQNSHSVENDLLSKTNSQDISSIQDVLKVLQRSLIGHLDDKLVLDVRRAYILKDALREAKKEKFNPKRMVKIRFTAEGGIDNGGPRREFFRLLGNKAKDVFFRGSDKNKFFEQNVSALQVGNLRSLGQFVAMSIIQGGNGFPFLAPPVYEYFVTGKCTDIAVGNGDIPDHMLQIIIEKIDDANNDDEVKVLFNVEEAADVLLVTGYRKAICDLRLNDKVSLKAALIDYHCLLKVKAEMDQFMDGLADCGVLEYIRQFPDLMRPLFTDCSTKQLTADDIKDLFRVVYSEDGSSHRPLQEQAWIHFCDFLDECEAQTGETGCAVTDILVFCCGAERIPPLGFGKDPKIVFLYKEDGKLATASTCDIILRLPTLHGDDYQSFKEAMIMSLKGNDGFGGV